MESVLFSINHPYYSIDYHNIVICVEPFLARHKTKPSV